MTTTDLTPTRRELARKRPADAVTSRNPNVIDGESRPTRSAAVEAIKFLALLVIALIFAGGLAASLGYSI